MMIPRFRRHGIQRLMLKSPILTITRSASIPISALKSTSGDGATLRQLQIEKPEDLQTACSPHHLKRSNLIFCDTNIIFFYVSQSHA